MHTLNINIAPYKTVPVLIVLLLAGFCTASEKTKSPPTPSIQKISDSALHNMIKISDRFYCGGEPDSNVAFAELKDRGIKTILSVDGLRPDLEAAQKHKLVYYHVPIGYDTIPESAQLQLVRVARDIKGPIYVHCHHGKHRGPAAMAVICQATNLFTTTDATKLLQEAGTSPNYRGLWKGVSRFNPPPPETKLPPLKHVTEVNDLIGNMAEIDRLFDELTVLVKEGKWASQTTPDETGLLLKELLFESGRALKQSQPEKTELIKFFNSAEQSVNSLQKSLKYDHNLKDGVSLKAWQSMKQECQRCHTKFRN